MKFMMNGSALRKSMGSDTSGYAVVDAGTLLEIKKGGILGVPYSD